MNLSNTIMPGPVTRHLLLLKSCPEGATAMKVSFSERCSISQVYVGNKYGVDGLCQEEHLPAEVSHVDIVPACCI